MGEITDKAAGRAKQAAGALTGDDDTKHEGQAQEKKGEVKGAVNDAVDKAEEKLNDLREKASRA